MGLKIKSLKLKNTNYGNQWFDQVEDRWDYGDFKKSEAWRKNWISFDCLCYHEPNDTVYAGITSFDADIFYGYRRVEQKFGSTGYERIANSFDAKFHRSLIEFQGCLYGAVALLHDIGHYWDAPGGAIVKYDPKTNELVKLGIPIAHNYIQSIALDRKRGLIYGQCFTPERLFVFDLETCQARDLGPLGSGLAMGQGENIVLDDSGNVWGGWSQTRAWQTAPGVDSQRLFKNDVHLGKMVYLEIGLPLRNGNHGYAKGEGYFNLGTDGIYISGDNGSLYHLKTETGKVDYLFTAIDNRPSRLASMAIGSDGFAYAVVGRDGDCQLMRFNPADNSYDLLGKIVDQDDVACWQIHDIIVLPDGTIYAGENDNPHRSGYLWEINGVVSSCC